MDVSCAPIASGDGWVGGSVEGRAGACPLLGPRGPGGIPQAERGTVEQDLSRRISQRTWGRLQFRVRLGAGRVIIEGRAPTYYLKQLALEAVREMLPSTPVQLEIRVA
jgi:hypothetical protein